MMSPVSRRMLPANLATVMIADVRDAREAAHLEKMMKPLKIQKMILNFDATFAEENDVVDAVVMTTAPEHQRMSHVSRRMLPVNLATATIADARAASEVASLEKMTRLQKNSKMILSFDATFAKANDVVDAVVMMTAPANQRMPLASQKMPPVNLVTMTTVNDARVAREAANHEKMTRLQKNPKTILSFDATLEKASDVVDDVMAAEVMTTAPVNQRMLLVHQRMSHMSQRTLLVNLVMIAKIVENVEVVVIL